MDPATIEPLPTLQPHRGQRGMVESRPTQLTLLGSIPTTRHDGFHTTLELYGAVAAYTLVAVLWAQLHALPQYFYPGAYAFGGTPKALDMTELIYFSFVALTTAGFGDVTPALVQSRYLTILEMIAGVMFVAILIARLTGVYPVVDKTIVDKKS